MLACRGAGARGPRGHRHWRHLPGAGVRPLLRLPPALPRTRGIGKPRAPGPAPAPPAAAPAAAPARAHREHRLQRRRVDKRERLPLARRELPRHQLPDPLLPQRPRRPQQPVGHAGGKVVGEVVEAPDHAIWVRVLLVHRGALAVWRRGARGAGWGVGGEGVCVLWWGEQRGPGSACGCPTGCRQPGSATRSISALSAPRRPPRCCRAAAALLRPAACARRRPSRP